MKLYVGITDTDWFQQLKADGPDEVNFWKPGPKGSFAALPPGGLFLFKLHSPQNFIVGGGYFVSFSRLPISLAWEAFGRKNGVEDLSMLVRRITKIRGGLDEPDPMIGCIILNAPFFWDRDLWIPVPEDFSGNVVQGKVYDTSDSVGAGLYTEVELRLRSSNAQPQLFVAEQSARYSEPYLAQARLGQGAFRVLVTDAYERRCAITGERTLPVLQASHIVPFSENGPHRVDNGLLLRADLHILFDQQLLTVTPDYRVKVSGDIRERFTNGKDYYALQDQPLAVLPVRADERPNPGFLAWHGENRFVA